MDDCRGGLKTRQFKKRTICLCTFENRIDETAVIDKVGEVKWCFTFSSAQVVDGEFRYSINTIFSLLLELRN